MKRIHIYILFMSVLALLPANGRAAERVELTNLVCFVRFAGEESSAFQNVYSDYDAIFNSEEAEAVSVYNYFLTASYGKLRWKSVFCPVQSGETVLSYETNMPRGYYQPYDEHSNADGYKDATEAAAREQGLVREIAEWADASLPGGANVDADGDGFVDNFTIVLSNGSDQNSSCLLWPHRSILAVSATVKNARLSGYLVVFDAANGYSNKKGGALNTGVLCHEMSHSLGTYDLYHSSGLLNPVGIWDLMSDNQLIAQQMTVYTKWRYCKWIDDIPELTESGNYSLRPQAEYSDTGNEPPAYKIRPLGSDEYFVLEYRKKEGFDVSLPYSGLIVYRINPSYSGGNVNYNGTTRLDEIYVFRPGGTTVSDGNIREAALSADNTYNALAGEGTMGSPFYSDGTIAPFQITDVSSCGDEISFTLHIDEDILVLSEQAVAVSPLEGAAASVKVSSSKEWSISNLPSWLAASSSEGVAGETEVLFTVTESNTTGVEREAAVFVNTDSQQKQITFTQKTASSALILYEDFENVNNPNNWEISTLGDRGWRFQEATGYYKSYEGRYTGTVYYAFDDIHQDEYLTTPLLSYASKMTFWSRSTASGATPTYPQYYIVEVSNDGGNNWTTLYNLCTDQGKEQSGQWQYVELDLSEYRSDNMLIRFHCYDTDNKGLSYYWSVDNISIYGIVTDINAVTDDKGCVQTKPRKVLQKNGLITIGKYEIGGRRLALP